MNFVCIEFVIGYVINEALGGKEQHDDNRQVVYCVIIAGARELSSIVSRRYSVSAYLIREGRAERKPKGQS